MEVVAHSSGRLRAKLIRCAPAAGMASGALALAWATTAQSLDAWFVGDDLGEIGRAFHGDQRGAHVRPLVAWGLRASREGGLDPMAFHLVSVVLHASVIMLVAWSAVGLHRALGGGRTSRPVAVASAVVFAVLGNHAEATSWISARGDLVVAAASLGAVGAWARRSSSVWWKVVALVAFVVGAAAKENAIAIPLLCAAVGWVTPREGRRTTRRALIEAWPLFAAGLAYVVVRALALGTVVGSYTGGEAQSWSPPTVLVRLMVKSARSVVPGMAAEEWVVAVVLASLALTGLLSAKVMALPRRGRRSSSVPELQPATLRMAGLGALLVVIALLPTAGLGVSLIDGRGDRLLYTPSAFASMVLGALGVEAWCRTSGRRRHLAVALMAVALLASALSALRSDARWAAAGRLTERTLASGDRWGEPRQVVVVNPIDNVAGAYAHRNTLGDAAVLVHGWPAPSLVGHLAPMEARTADAGVVVDRTGVRAWRLRPQPGSRFLDLPGGTQAWSAFGLHGRLDGDRALVLTAEPDVELENIWVVVGGRLEDLSA